MLGPRLHPAFSCGCLCLPISLGSRLGQGPGTGQGRTAPPAPRSPEVGRLGSQAPPGAASAGGTPHSLAAPPISLARTWPARDVVEVTHPARPRSAGQGRWAGWGREQRTLSSRKEESHGLRAGHGNWFPRSGPLRAFTSHTCCGVWRRTPQRIGTKLGADLPDLALAWRGEPACPPSRLPSVHSLVLKRPQPLTSPKTWRS